MLAVNRWLVYGLRVDLGKLCRDLPNHPVKGNATPLFDPNAVQGATPLSKLLTPRLLDIATWYFGEKHSIPLIAEWLKTNTRDIDRDIATIRAIFARRNITLPVPTCERRDAGRHERQLDPALAATL